MVYKVVNTADGTTATVIKNMTLNDGDFKGSLGFGMSFVYSNSLGDAADLLGVPFYAIELIKEQGDESE